MQGRPSAGRLADDVIMIKYHVHHMCVRSFSSFPYNHVRVSPMQAHFLIIFLVHSLAVVGLCVHVVCTQVCHYVMV